MLRSHPKGKGGKESLLLLVSFLFLLLRYLDLFLWSRILALRMIPGLEFGSFLVFLSFFVCCVSWKRNIGGVSFRATYLYLGLVHVVQKVGGVTISLFFFGWWWSLVNKQICAISPLSGGVNSGDGSWVQEKSQSAGREKKAEIYNLIA